MLLENRATIMKQAMNLSPKELSELNRGIETMYLRAMEKHPELKIDVNDCFYMMRFLPEQYNRIICRSNDIMSSIITHRANPVATFIYRERRNIVVLCEPEEAHFRIGLKCFGVEVSIVYYPFIRPESEQYWFQICYLDNFDGISYTSDDILNNRSICGEVKVSSNHLRCAGSIMSRALKEMRENHMPMKYCEMRENSNKLLNKLITEVEVEESMTRRRKHE